MLELEKDIKKAYATIDLDHKIVGVKLIKGEEEFKNYDAVSVSRSIPYCVAVKSATLGHSVKFTENKSGCGGSTRALGLEKPSDDFLDGIEGLGTGLYKNQNIAKNSAKGMTNIPHNTYGVLVQPIEKYNEKIHPDVVLIIGKPREMMRVMQGYSYHYGITKNISISGNQAICLECTANPLINNDINVSFLCAGTRYLADWSDNEVALGMPFTMFSKVIDGIYKTVNVIEMDKRKNEINEELSDIDNDEVKIEYGKTYFTERERRNS